MSFLCSCSAKSAGPSSLPTITHSRQHVVCCLPLIPLFVQPHDLFSVFCFQHALSEQDPKSAPNTDLGDMPLKHLRQQLMNLSLSNRILFQFPAADSRGVSSMLVRGVTASLVHSHDLPLWLGAVMSDLLSSFCSCPAVVHVCYPSLVDNFLWDVFLLQLRLRDRAPTIWTWLDYRRDPPTATAQTRSPQPQTARRKAKE